MENSAVDNGLSFGGDFCEDPKLITIATHHYPSKPRLKVSVSLLNEFCAIALSVFALQKHGIV